MFLVDIPFDISKTIGSVVLMALTSTSAIEALEMSMISSDFVHVGVWVAARHS